MAFENPWIGYVDRTYQQIKTAVLSRMAILVPEITDHTESNPLVKFLSIWSGIAEMIGYYIDNAAREAHLVKCRLYVTGVKIAKSYDYRIHSRVASTGTVTFTLSGVHGSDITIPEGTEVEDTDGKKYLTSADLVITAGNLTGDISVEQIEIVTGVALGNSAGTADQEFVINANVNDGSVEVLVNGIAWTKVDTLGFSLPTDEHFLQTINESKQVIIRFGDNWAGKIPTAGHSIVVSYEITEGLDSEAGTIDQINTSLSLPIGITATVTNELKTSGASDIESLAQMKVRIPKSIRTLIRAVSDTDHEDVAELYPSVAKAKATYACGTGAEIWIAPLGGGVASDVLVGNVQTWMSDTRRRLLGRNPTVKAAGIVRFKFKLRVNIGNQYNRTTTVNLIKSNLAAFFSIDNQDIKGSVFLSDIYQTIEGTTGVLNSQVEIMKAKPYARRLSGTHDLTWDANVTDDNSTTVKWRIVMLSGTTYQLFKDGSYVGTHTTGDIVTKAEVVFTVTPATYTIGDQWEFYSYRSLGNIALSEYSVPFCEASDIEIVAYGGLL